MRARRFTIAALVISLAFACAAQAAANPGSVAGAIPSAQVAAMLKAKRVMIGYGNGDMRWGNTITRAEAVKLLLAAIGEVTPSLSRAPAPFGDVSQDHWAFSHISMAWEMGVVRGRPGNIFDPEEGVTMAEFMVMVSRVYVGLGSEAGAPNPRVQIKPEWASPEIAGWPDLVQLITENSRIIDLDYPASRGEIGILAGRIMERLGLAYDLSGILKDYSAGARRLLVVIEDGGRPVEVGAADGILWFSEDGFASSSALIGRKVYIVLDSEGRAGVVLSQLR